MHCDVREDYSTVCMIGATHIYLSLSKSPFFLLILLSSSLNGVQTFFSSHTFLLVFSLQFTEVVV